MSRDAHKQQQWAHAPTSFHAHPTPFRNKRSSRARLSVPFTPPSSKQSNDGSMDFHSTKREYLHSRGASASQTFTIQHLLQRGGNKNESLLFCSFPLRPKEPGLPCIQVCSPRRPPSVSRPVPQSMEGTRDGGPLKVRGCRWPLGGVMLQKAVHKGPCTSMRCRFWHRFRSSSKLKGYSGPGPLP